MRARGASFDPEAAGRPGSSKAGRASGEGGGETRGWVRQPAREARTAARRPAKTGAKRVDLIFSQDFSRAGPALSNSPHLTLALPRLIIAPCSPGSPTDQDMEVPYEATGPSRSAPYRPRLFRH